MKILTTKTLWLSLSHLHSAVIGFYAYGEFVDGSSPGIGRWILALGFQAIYLILYLRELDEKG
jgi:hypothetical protein